MGCLPPVFRQHPGRDDAVVIAVSRMVFGAGCLKVAGAHAKAQGMTRVAVTPTAT